MGVWMYVIVASMCLSLMAYEVAHFLFGENPFCEVGPPVSALLFHSIACIFWIKAF